MQVRMRICGSTRGDLLEQKTVMGACSSNEKLPDNIFVVRNIHDDNRKFPKGIIEVTQVELKYKDAQSGDEWVWPLKYLRKNGCDKAITRSANRPSSEGEGGDDEMETEGITHLDGADKEGKRDKKEAPVGVKRGRGATSGAPPTKTMQLSSEERVATASGGEKEEDGEGVGEGGEDKKKSTGKQPNRKSSTHRPRTRPLSNSDSLVPGVTTPTKTSPMTRSHSAVKKDVEIVSRPSTKKRKKGGGGCWPKRVAYSEAQQDALELAFHAKPYPDGFFRQVSRQVGIPEHRIQVWFRNRRQRGKSRKSLIREQWLKANLASKQSQQQFTQHQKSLELPSQPLELPGQSQQQLQLPGQAQQHQELPHGQLEEHGSHPQQIQQLQLHQPQGMEQSHLDQQQLQVQTESQQMASGSEKEEDGEGAGEGGEDKKKSTGKQPNRKSSTHRPRTRPLSNSDSLVPGVTTPTKTSPMTRSHSAVKKDVEIVSRPSTKKWKKGGGGCWPKRVATLATANAVIDDRGEREEEGDSNNVPTPESLPNHSPSFTQLNNALFRLPPGLHPPPPPPPSSPPHSRRPKRTRTAYSEAQQDALELAFHAQPDPDGFFRQVSRQVGIPEDRIQVWFRNRRKRGKSRKSLIREQWLKANLASKQSQQQFTQHQKSLELPSQPLELPGQSQQQLQLPGQAQQQQELPHGQLEEHGSHPQQIQQLQLHQPQGMEQSHLDQQQLQVQTESQQMLEQQQTELQQKSCESNEVPTSPTITSSGSIEISQLQISSPFTLPPATPEGTDLPTTAGCVPTESPSFPVHSDSADTLYSQEIPHTVFSNNICYFPQTTPQQSLSPNPSTHHLMSGANSATALNVPLPQIQSHSATYRFPPTLAHSPSFEHLYSPNPSFQFPHPSPPSNFLRPFFPSPFYHYQQQQPYHHMGLVGGESISPVSGAGDSGSYSAPSSVWLPVRDTGAQQPLDRAGAGALRERPSPLDPTPPDQLTSLGSIYHCWD